MRYGIEQVREFGARLFVAKYVAQSSKFEAGYKKIWRWGLPLHQKIGAQSPNLAIAPIWSPPLWIPSLFRAAYMAVIPQATAWDFGKFTALQESFGFFKRKKTK